MARETIQWLRALRALALDASLVIVSDRDQPEEVLAALDAGALGFLPTDLEPELALQAFSFVLMGGTYFPPSAIETGGGAVWRLGQWPRSGRWTGRHAAIGKSRERRVQRLVKRPFFAFDSTRTRGAGAVAARLGK